MRTKLSCYFLVGLAWLYTGCIVSPIRQIASDPRNVAQGEASLHDYLGYSKKDKLDELVHWFNVYLYNTSKQVASINNEVANLNTLAGDVQTVSDNLTTSTTRQVSTNMNICL